MNQKVALFYFSGTGNTWWCCEKLATQLQQLSLETMIFSIEQCSLEDIDHAIEQCDLIGLAYPIYGSDVPLVTQQFITDVLPINESGKKLFVFCTQLMFSGDGAYVMEKALQDKKWKIQWSAHIIMPNNVCVSAMPFPYSNERKKLDPILMRAENRLSDFAKAIIEEKTYKQGSSFIAKPLGLSQRAPFRKMFPNMRDDISIDEDRCIHCLRCVHICPNGNLTVEKGKIIAHGQCMLCTRCYNYCPAKAIKYHGKSHPMKKEKPYQGPVKTFKPEDICNKIKIRQVSNDEMDSVRTLVWNTFLEFEAPDYSQEGVDTFHKEIIQDEMYLKECEVYGAYIEGTLAAIFSTKRKNHINLAFTNKEFQKRGLARMLFHKVQNHIKNDGYNTITVNSSPFAVPFYEHLGFHKTAEEDCIHGIRFTPMIFHI